MGRAMRLVHYAPSLRVLLMTTSLRVLLMATGRKVSQPLTQLYTDFFFSIVSKEM